MLLAVKNWEPVKAIIFLLSLLPFLLLTNNAFNDRLGANPIQALHFGFGNWALRFLCITLALTPIKIITGHSKPMRYRRMMGLFTFFTPACICWFLSFLIYRYPGTLLKTRCLKALTY